MGVWRTRKAATLLLFSHWLYFILYGLGEIKICSFDFVKIMQITLADNILDNHSRNVKSLNEALVY